MRFVVLALALASGTFAQRIAIRDVSVIDVVSSAVRPHMTVTIAGDKIASIAPASAPIPAATRIVIGTGKFLIPGLWDMHVHLFYRESQLPMFIAYGVTGVQDMGSDFDKTAAARAAIETGKAIGPHILTSGPPVNNVADDNKNLPILVARTPVEARAAFDKLYDMDVDFVKVLSGLSADAYFALAEQARHWHMRLEGHVPSSINADHPLNSPQASIEHMFGVMKTVSTDEEAMRFFEKCELVGTAISPTLVLWQRMAHLTDAKLMSDPQLK